MSPPVNRARRRLVAGVVVEVRYANGAGELVYKSDWPAGDEGIRAAHREWKQLWDGRYAPALLWARCERDFCGNFYGLIVVGVLAQEELHDDAKT